MLSVISVTPGESLQLRLEFNDGSVGDVDCSFLTDKGLGVALRDPDVFRQVRVDDEMRTIIWPNGLDPAPELLRSHLTPVGIDSAAA